MSEGLLHLRSDGDAAAGTGPVSVVLDLRGDGVPSMLHWGTALHPDTDLAATALAVEQPVPRAALDERVPLSLLPEHALGWTGSPGLEGQRPDGTAWSPVLRRTSAEATGSAVRIACEDDLAGLGLEVELALHPASGVLSQRLTVTNTGAQDWLVGRLGCTLPLPDTLGEVLELPGRWCKELQPQRRPWGLGSVVRENRRGRTSHDNPPSVVLGTPGFSEGTGEVAGVHVAWSGNAVLRAERVISGQAYVQGGELLLPGELVLRPGERYATPWLHAAWSGTGLGGMSAAFHAFLRDRPGWPGPGQPRKVVVNTWEAVYFDHDHTRLTALADAAAEVGAERFVLDDGWFGSRRHDGAGLGDWVVDPGSYPQGLGPLIEHVHSRAMDFGLWVEPEMVNPDSDLYRAHPDWVLAAAGYPPITGRSQLVLDLGRPEVSAHLLERLDALLTEYAIAYLKWDMNRDLVQAAGVDGRAGVHAQTLAVYALMDELVRRHPGLEIESCSSGGARADMAVLERTRRIWTSDCNDALDRQGIQRGFSYFFPPEVMGAHVGPPQAHTTGRVHTTAFRAATAFFGHLGMEWDVSSATPAERAVLASVVAEHKRLRPLLHGGRVVRLDLPDPAALGHGVVAPDASAALFAYVQLEQSTTTVPGRLRARGLEPTRRYRVAPLRLGDEGCFGPTAQPPGWLREGAPPLVLNGEQLAVHGLAMPVLHPESALLVELTAEV